MTNFFDPSYFKGAVDQGYDLCPSLYNLIFYFRQSKLIDSTANLTNKNYSAEFVDNITSYWAAYGNGEGPGECQPKYYDGEQMPGMVTH